MGEKKRDISWASTRWVVVVPQGPSIDIRTIVVCNRCGFEVPLSETGTDLMKAHLGTHKDKLLA